MDESMEISSSGGPGTASRDVSLQEKERGHEDDADAASDGSDDSIGADLLLVDKLYPSARTSQPSPPVPDARMRRRSAITHAMIAPDDISYHPGAHLSFFAPPRQRQSWGDTQVLPRVNWGDLFFDLFYVAAAYNTSNILVDSPSLEGILYFAGTFLSVMNIWMLKTFFDSRFVVGDDLWHRIYEIVKLSALAASVVHIQPVSIMSNPEKYHHMFAFSLSLLVINILAFSRYIELYYFGIGQEGIIKAVAVREGRPLVLPISILAAATIIAGVAFYGNDADEEDPHRLMRLLAGSNSSESEYEKKSDSNHIPMWLCLCSVLIYWVPTTIRVIFLHVDFEQYKKISVPVNVGFVIHRQGEWVMLMLGESILSLLIVDVDASDSYYLTIYSDLLTVIILQYLHFRSQPHSADDHALRRDKNAGIISQWFQFFYSGSLVAFGAAVTLFILGFANSEHRRLSEGRSLAGGGSAFEGQDLKERTAHLYSASLALILFTLDSLCLLHVGFQKCNDCATKNVNIPGMLLVLVRFLTIVFAATLSQWTNDPETLSELGLGVVIFQVVLRLLGYVFFPQKVYIDVHESSTPEKTKDPENGISSGSSSSQ